jgi:Phosphodiester glycosidase/FlgD Ig-like domain
VSHSGRLYESCKNLQIGGSGSDTLDRAVLRRAPVVGLATASLLALAGSGSAQPAPLLPRVTYEQDVQFTPHGPVAIHVVRGPRPVGLYRLRPVLSNEAVLGRETVSAMQRRLASRATAVGVNGDFFASAREGPSGILMRDGVLVRAPSPNRSSAGITLDGALDVRQVRLSGTWRGLGPGRTLNALNEPPGANEVALFTPDWGAPTPRIRGAVAMVLSPFPAATPNVPLAGGVSDFVQNASVPVAPETAVLVARGTAAQRLLAEAPLGTTLTIELFLGPGWEAVGDAIGGGPVLVRDGVPVLNAREAFTRAQLVPRHPRTAVGQLADGRIVMVVVDGRRDGYSVGMTTFEMAQTMLRLGAVSAMQFDGGGSSTLAFDGRVLNRPSDGRERPISSALMLFYTGAYARPPLTSIYSPNGDGIGESQTLAYKIVRPSTVTAKLIAPDGSVAYEETAPKEPGTYAVPFPPPPLPPPEVEGVPPLPLPPPGPPAEGRWTLTVTSTDDLAQTSTTTRRFWVNSTLGSVKVEPRTLLLRPKRARSATVTWSQARPALVTVRVETSSGLLVRRLARRTFETGKPAVSWDGRLRNRKLAPGGTYRVRVTASNQVGTVTLEAPLRVRRLAPQG